MFKLNELLIATGGKLRKFGLTESVKGISVDSRTIRPREVFIAIKGNDFDGHNFIGEAIKKGANCIIYSEKREARPSTTLGTRSLKFKKNVAYIEVIDTTKALGDIARYHRQKFNIPIIAVTGSNGKTTTKDMLAWVLSRKFRVLKNQGTYNNHIGLPLTLLKLRPSFDIAVLELGTNHFGEIDYLSKICLANIGVITNIASSHLEFLNDLAGVLREKYSLAGNMREPHILVLNYDDAMLSSRLLEAENKLFILGFALENKANFSASDIKVKGRLNFKVNSRKEIFSLDSPARHNLYNALAATAVARLFGLSYRDITRMLFSFKFPSTSINLVKFKNINFLDDTYNSNPFSLKAALETLADFKTEGRRVLVMGDMLELGGREAEFHRRAGVEAAKICDILLTVGKLSKLAAGAARECGFNIKNIYTCDSPERAGIIIRKKLNASSEDIILVKGSRAMRMERVFKE